VPLIADPARHLLSGAYPDTPVMLPHNLADHPLLQLDALARAAEELDPDLIERRVHDARNGEAFTLVGYGEAAGTLAAGGPAQQWIMLRLIERLPRYRALLEAIIADLGTAITHTTGAPSRLKGFVFVSAPHTHTPFHFDAEFNILFQIAGTKTFATYPPRAPYLGLDERETYHRNGDNMLGWQEAYWDDAQLHHLSPGEAVFVPYAAPHWVKAGPEPSISLSLTWQNPWSDALADALALNPLLRRLRLPVTDPARGSGAPRWRALAGRIGQKAGVL
jgi:hypothetical protein